MDAIIFDLGGVLLSLDFARTARAFSALGSVDFFAKWTPTKQESFFERFETGHLDAASFRQELRRSLGVPHASDAELDAAWNAMLVDLPAEKLALLQTLRQRHKLYLLSNTNEIHLDHLHGTCCAPHGVASLEPFFDKVYFSCRIKARKPDSAAFQHVLDDADLQAERTLFVDDLRINVEAARRVGLQAVHLQPGMPLAAVVP